MRTYNILMGFALFSGSTIAAPVLDARAGSPCFVVGNAALPAEVQTSVAAIQNAVTCDASTKTIGTVPDTISGGVKFSDINFADSKSNSLDFALSTFATATPLASSDLAKFQNELNVYLATEAGLRSTGGNLAVKAPKFFLAYQIARIKTAQGTKITDPGQTVDHLLGKVIKNASSGTSQATKDAITALSTQLS